MKKRVLAGVLLLGILFCVPVHGEVADFETALNAYRQDGVIPPNFWTTDGGKNRVRVMQRLDTVFVTARETLLYVRPGESAQGLETVLMGTKLSRIGVCNNGWSKVVYEGEKRVIGYVPNRVLSDRTEITEVSETVQVLQDSDILNYPGRKDGEVVGEVLEMDEVRRTARMNDTWSRISYTDMDGQEQTGYIVTSALDVKDGQASSASTETEGEDGIEAGILSKSDGKGIFAEAVEGVTSPGGAMDENGVQIGNAQAVSSDASLVPLGTFRITHYCQCSICCGPWANGITSTGVTATTNRTIAVDPTQIPYGSQVVINGQVYVAEDCGGAIKTNCIDIYVASHAEGESKGVYYTDVYLVQ